MQLQLHRPLPSSGAASLGANAASGQRRVEQFLYHQAELLDGKYWGAVIDLFAEEGIYWMPVIESASETQIVVRSRFQMLESRRDELRHFGGTYQHTLKVSGDEFKIVLQRVDMLNAQAPFDYVLQIWV